MKPYLSLAVLLGLILGACTPTSSTANIQTVTIGVIAPMSGDASALGEEAQRVLNYSLPILNERVKEQGYQFKLAYEDGKCDGMSAATAFQKMNDLDQISFIIGGLCSSESLAIAPLLTEDNALVLSAGSSNPELEGSSSNLFSLSYSDSAIGQEIAHQLSKYQKIAILTEQNDYNLGLKEVVAQSLNDQNIEIVFNENFAKGATDFRNQLQKIKNSGADAVFLNPNPGVTTESMVRQIAEIKDWNLPIVSQISFLGSSVYGIAPELLANYGTVVDAPQVNDPEFQTYFNDIVSTQGDLSNLGSYYTATYVDSLNILADAIIATEGDVEAARDMVSSEHLQGFIGDIYFGGHTFSQNNPTAVFKFVDGAWVIQ